MKETPSPTNYPVQIHSRMIVAGGLRTHFLEAGAGFPVVLLHSGEFGGCAELSWENTIAPLAEHFHVYAPDWAGFGRSEKAVSFSDPWGFRIRHITAFLAAMGIERAHFIGNSMGGTLLLQVTASRPCPWPIERAIVIAGGGSIPENPARETLNSDDGSLEHMRRIVQVMFANQRIVQDEAYIARRHLLSHEGGAWEATAAARLRAPWREPGSRMPQPPDYSKVERPVLLVTGGKDPLRNPGFGEALRADIPGSQLHVFADAGHCPHIDSPEDFNRLALQFLMES